MSIYMYDANRDRGCATIAIASAELITLALGCTRFRIAAGNVDALSLAPGGHGAMTQNAGDAIDALSSRTYATGINRLGEKRRRIVAL